MRTIKNVDVLNNLCISRYSFLEKVIEILDSGITLDEVRRDILPHIRSKTSTESLRTKILDIENKRDSLFKIDDRILLNIELFKINMEEGESFVDKIDEFLKLNELNK